MRRITGISGITTTRGSSWRSSGSISVRPRSRLRLTRTARRRRPASSSDSAGGTARQRCPASCIDRGLIGSVAPSARPETELRAEVRTSGGIRAKRRFCDEAAGAAEAADAARHRQEFPARVAETRGRPRLIVPIMHYPKPDITLHDSLQNPAGSAVGLSRFRRSLIRLGALAIAVHSADHVIVGSAPRHPSIGV